ncbi:DUF4827 domain-containing protein [Bacteroidia bacterium]|nr:DUF4827 domain-containing protein [Bacteroidia bacterium]
MKKGQYVPQGQYFINRRLQPTGIMKLVISLVATVFATMSCDTSKTLQEYIDEEKDAIRKYLSMQEIEVLSIFPADTTFKENEYFRASSDGLYFRVAKKGTGRQIKSMNEVLVRFDYFYYVKSFVSKEGADTIFASTFANYFPMEFQYGNPYSYGKNTYDLSCNGWAVPLSYVNEGTVIDLLVPSALGTSSDNSGFSPVFYKNLIYRMQP